MWHLLRQLGAREAFSLSVFGRGGKVWLGIAGIMMSGMWVANGLSQDLPLGVVMAGAWQGAELAIWRSASGRLSAWNDRCPHRGMRLSHGFVRGETLSCIYHGWTYGSDGACGKIPAHPAMVPPAAIKAEVYQCVEVGGVIWVAPVGAELALPDLSGLVAVRSITVQAGVAEIARTLPGFVCEGAVWRGQIGGAAVALVLQDRGAAVTLHALGVGDRVTVSRWLDGLRRLVEEGALA
ncbi:MAG: Rieske 2Fe-2S domain-containing protein [Cypionkella sp.]|uniref:Rieske 2Fe-2S domain-containing protein n=1 Tax=Cypionkella sp. TaxID=2811411 RepID=UPI002AB847A0|nr:Rieske 2Fe-2S domain-containing protein [Cypionkella sp.]MDZ4309565.1 Rieske 2Fe-2S domain-containing protein [Cypionkella sp.]